MELKFKKISIRNDDERKEVLKNIRILEDTTNQYIAGINRLLYTKN